MGQSAWREERGRRRAGNHERRRALPRCAYCLPKGFKDFEEPARWLIFDEIERLVGVFARPGVSRVRLTGGEPLLRRNLPDLVARLYRLPGIRDISLSTNATQLEKHARALKAAGVTRINVSLDSLKVRPAETLDIVVFLIVFYYSTEWLNKPIFPARFGKFIGFHPATMGSGRGNEQA